MMFVMLASTLARLRRDHPFVGRPTVVDAREAVAVLAAVRRDVAPRARCPMRLSCPLHSTRKGADTTVAWPRVSPFRGDTTGFSLRQTRRSLPVVPSLPQYGMRVAVYPASPACAARRPTSAPLHLVPASCRIRRL